MLKWISFKYNNLTDASWHSSRFVILAGGIPTHFLVYIFIFFLNTLLIYGCEWIIKSIEGYTDNILM